MSGFFQDNQNNDTGAGISSGAILRDFQHASLIFRPNAYENAPKLKFLFHTYFEFNAPINLPEDVKTKQSQVGILVKEVKLPSFTLQTAQYNQYNRKRIGQSKIKYDPIEISFHDDNGNLSTLIWQNYYQYYYNDMTSVGPVLSGQGQSTQPSGPNDYNSRNMYDSDLSSNMGWGFLGGDAAGTATKVPFFKNITIFGFNSHRFTAYTLINPMITNFQHDTYNYSESGGTMTNRMTIDYETVVYNYGNMDGKDPGNIVKGFGDPYYDSTKSPITTDIGQSQVIGQGGLAPAGGGSLQYTSGSSVAQAQANSQASYASFNKTTSSNNNLDIGKSALTSLFKTTLNNNPSTRNAGFNIPVAQSSPGPAGLSGSPTIGATNNPQVVTPSGVNNAPPFAGVQYTNI